MAHKTLISGTAYSVTGGRELIGGTGYDCKAGKTLIGGTAFTVPFSKGIPLSTVTPGAVLNINDIRGNDIPLYVAKHDYESDLNGPGKTLVTFKFLVSYTAFGNSTSKNGYAKSELNKVMASYMNVLGKITNEIEPTKFYFTPGNGDYQVTTMSAKIFSLSLTELGYKVNTSIINEEGSELPIASMMKVGTLENGTAKGYWTRTPSSYRDGSMEDYFAAYSNIDGTGRLAMFGAKEYSRPAFTLPGALSVVQNADGTYTLAA